MGKRLIAGVSEVSGAPFAVELLRQLHERHPEVETHLIITKGGAMTLPQETDVSLEELKSLASVCHGNWMNVGANALSGDGYYADELVLKANSLHGQWKNGTLECTLKTSGLEWYIGDYEYTGNNSGREWSVLDGAGNGIYTFISRSAAVCLLGSFLQLPLSELSHRPGFSRTAFLLSWMWIALSILLPPASPWSERHRRQSSQGKVGEEAVLFADPFHKA